MNITKVEIDRRCWNHGPSILKRLDRGLWCTDLYQSFGVYSLIDRVSRGWGFRPQRVSRNARKMTSEANTQDIWSTDQGEKKESVRSNPRWETEVLLLVPVPRVGCHSLVMAGMKRVTQPSPLRDDFYLSKLTWSWWMRLWKRSGTNNSKHIGNTTLDGVPIVEQKAWQKGKKNFQLWFALSQWEQIKRYSQVSTLTAH